MEYKFRNLTMAGATHFVSGNFKNETDEFHEESGGIQEWCYDEDDAKNIMALMQQDPRFSNLQVEEWQDEDDANWELAEEIFWSDMEEKSKELNKIWN